jgi:hypothetical protein
MRVTLQKLLSLGFARGDERWWGEFESLLVVRLRPASDSCASSGAGFRETAFACQSVRLRLDEGTDADLPA